MNIAALFSSGFRPISAIFGMIRQKSLRIRWPFKHWKDSYYYGEDTNARTVIQNYSLEFFFSYHQSNFTNIVSSPQ